MKALAQGTLFLVFAVVAGVVAILLWIGWEAVSYTHLTLPTSDLV